MFGDKSREIRRLREKLARLNGILDETRADRDELDRMCTNYHDRYERLHGAYKALQQRMLDLHPSPPMPRAFLMDPPVEQWRRELMERGES